MSFFSKLKSVFTGRQSGALTRSRAPVDVLALASQLGREAGERAAAELNEAQRQLQRVWSATEGAYDPASYDGRLALRDEPGRNVWVGTSGKRIADALSQMDFCVESQARDGSYVESVDHPATKLLKSPEPGKPWPIWAGLMAWRLWFQGEVIIVPIRARSAGRSKKFPDKGIPIELHQLEPAETEKIRGRDGRVVAYKDTRDGQVYPIDEVMRIYFPDPYDSTKALAPFKWVKAESDTDVKAQIWNSLSFDNTTGARHLFTIDPPDSGWTSKEQYDEARERFEDAYKGALNANRDVIAGHQIKAQTLRSTPVEMDHVEGRKLQREGTSGGMGVPPMLNGIMDQSALNNFKIAELVFWRLTIMPLLITLTAFFRLYVLDEFEERDSGHRFRFKDELVAALQSVFEETGKLAIEYAKAGVPWSELNRRFSLGFREWEGWDRPLVKTSGTASYEGEREGPKLRAVG